MDQYDSSAPIVASIEVSIKRGPRGITSCLLNACDIRPTTRYLRKRVSLDSLTEHNICPWVLGTIVTDTIGVYDVQLQIYRIGVPRCPLPARIAGR